jgi:predicted component of type VI protein secretion system
MSDIFSIREKAEEALENIEAAGSHADEAESSSRYAQDQTSRAYSSIEDVMGQLDELTPFDKDRIDVLVRVSRAVSTLNSIVTSEIEQAIENNDQRKSDGFWRSLARTIESLYGFNEISVLAIKDNVDIDIVYPDGGYANYVVKEVKNV